MQKLRTTSLIERTAGRSRPRSSRTTDNIVAIEDTVKVKLYNFSNFAVEYSFLFPRLQKYKRRKCGSYSPKYKVACLLFFYGVVVAVAAAAVSMIRYGIFTCAQKLTRWPA